MEKIKIDIFALKLQILFLSLENRPNIAFKYNLSYGDSC